MATTSKKSDKEEKKAETAAPVTYSTAAQRVLRTPRISEKSSHLTKVNKYVFNVALKANKVEIKKAIEDTYKVKVVQVNVVTGKGKTRNFGRTHGRTSDFKKAIVTLKQGDAIKSIE